MPTYLEFEKELAEIEKKPQSFVQSLREIINWIQIMKLNS